MENFSIIYNEQKRMEKEISFKIVVEYNIMKRFHYSDINIAMKKSSFEFLTCKKLFHKTLRHFELFIS